ncbi:MAG: hypothetical protein RL354_1767 [Planctomycetota bacterium]
MHLLLRTRPDLAREWDDDEVVRRYETLFPQRPGARGVSRRKAGPSSSGRTPTSRGRAHILRGLLSDLGFFHRQLKEPCARLWNRMDGVTGHFWEGRYKSLRVLDDASLLRVASYVELNEVRAQASTSVVSSMWSGARRQWANLRDALREQLLRHGCHEEPVARVACALPWRSPFASSSGGDQSTGQLRSRSTPQLPSLNMPLASYLHVIDLDGRRQRPDKRGCIPPTTPGAIEEAVRSALRQYDRLCAAGLRLARSTADAFVRRLSGAIERRLGVGALAHTTVSSEGIALRARGTCYGSTSALAAEARRRGVVRVIAAQAGPGD